MAETVIYDPSNQGMNNALPWMLANNNGWGNGLGGWGGGILGFILGALVGNGGFFGNGWGGGNFGGAAAASLGAQATANNNTDLILNAINGTDADVRLLASTLNSDVDSVRIAINSVQGAIATLSAQVGLSGQQIINSIQSGNSELAAKLCQCCCENKLLVTSQGYENQLRTAEQTSILGSAIAANGQRTVDAISDLKTAMVSEFCAARERDMQAKIDTQADVITQLRGQIDNANQTAQIAAMIAPIAKEVDDVKCKLPNTVSVNWPNLVAVNTTPYVSGGFYQGGYNSGYYGPGYNNGIIF